jgi:hypothetical protein
MALLRGERDTNPILALAAYRQHADLLEGQEKGAMATLAARLEQAGLPALAARVVGSVRLEPEARAPTGLPVATGVTQVTQIKDQLAHAARPLAGTADEVTDMLSSRIEAVRAGLAPAGAGSPAPAASAM